MATDAADLASANEPLVASVKETCSMLGLGPTKVTAMIKSGELKSTLIGRRRLVLRSSITALFSDIA